MQMINWFLKVKNKNTKSPVPEVQQEEDSESQNSAQVRGSENPCTYQAPQMLASPIKRPHTL